MKKITEKPEKIVGLAQSTIMHSLMHHLFQPLCMCQAPFLKLKKKLGKYFHSIKIQQGTSISPK